jgi:hypothetical protein
LLIASVTPGLAGLAPQAQEVGFPPAQAVGSLQVQEAGYLLAPAVDFQQAQEVGFPPAQAVGSLQVQAILGDVCPNNRQTRGWVVQSGQPNLALNRTLRDKAEQRRLDLR